jgi:hypothetical protein
MRQRSISPISIVHSPPQWAWLVTPGQRPTARRKPAPQRPIMFLMFGWEGVFAGDFAHSPTQRGSSIPPMLSLGGRAASSLRRALGAACPLPERARAVDRSFRTNSKSAPRLGKPSLTETVRGGRATASAAAAPRPRRLRRATAGMNAAARSERARAGVSGAGDPGGR